LTYGQNFRENNYDCTNVLMRYTQLPNHFPNKFWCSRLDHQKRYMDPYVW